MMKIFRKIKKSYKNSKAVLIISRLIPYKIGNSLLRLFFVIPKFKSTLFGRLVAPLTEVVGIIHPQKSPRAEDFVRYLSVNSSRHWRLIALSKTSDSEFNRIVRFEGLEILQNAIDKNNGVIVANSHFGAVRCIPLSMIRRGFDLTSIEAANILKIIGASHSDELKVIEVGVKSSFLLRQAYQSRKVLSNGGILHIVADGLQGQSGTDVVFLGRKWKFANGFAELAVSTGAAVIPVIAWMEDTGQIVIRFYQSLNTDEGYDSKDGQIRGLVEQYANFLEQRWKEDIFSVRTPHLRYYLGLPLDA